MIRAVVICGLVLIVIAAPIKDEKQAKIISYVSEHDGKGNYKFSFQTSNGIFREESGTVVNEGKPDQYISVEGTVSFPDSEGDFQEFSYIADNNGFQILPSQDLAILEPNVVASLLG